MDPLLLSCWDEVKHLIGIELIRSICIVCKQNIEEAPSKKACIGGCQAMLCGNAECAQFFGQTHNRRVCAACAGVAAASDRAQNPANNTKTAQTAAFAALNNAYERLMPLFDRMDDESARDRLLIAMHTRECAGLLGTVPQVTHTCLTVAFVFEELEMHAYAMQMMQGVLRLAQRAFGEHDMWVAKMHHSTGLMQVSVGDAAGALASFKASRAVLLAQPSPSLAHLVPVTNDVAVEAFKLKQYDEALQAYRDTRVYLEQQITTDGRPSVRMAQLLHDTAVVLHDKGAEHEAEAMQLYRDSLALHRAAGNNRSEALARCLRDKSRLHRSRQEVSDALSALEDALQTIQEISDDDVSRLLVDVLAERGEILFGLQRNVEAKDMFLQAISVASGWADEGFDAECGVRVFLHLALVSDDFIPALAYRTQAMTLMATLGCSDRVRSMFASATEQAKDKDSLNIVIKQLLGAFTSNDN